jgi:hypothetical protein
MQTPRRRPVAHHPTPPARQEAPTGAWAGPPRRSDARTGAGDAGSPAVGLPDHSHLPDHSYLSIAGLPTGLRRVSGGCRAHDPGRLPPGRDVDPRPDEVRQRPGLLGPERLFWEYNGYSLYGDLS